MQNKDNNNFTIIGDNNYSQPVPPTTPPITKVSSSQKPINSLLLVIVIIILILSITGLSLGIYSTIQVNKILSVLDLEYLKGAEDEDVSFSDIPENNEDELISCVPPQKTSNINNIYIHQTNQDINVDESNEIVFYNYSNGRNNDSKVISINTDTSEIFDYVFTNTATILLDNDNHDLTEDNNWYIQIDTNEGTCLMGGDETPPEWFNNLIAQIKTKEDSL